MLMNMPSEARNGHEQQRNTHPTHAACLSGGVGLVCRTPRLDPEAPGAVPQAKALSSPTSDQGAGISSGYSGWLAALAGHQPGSSSLGEGSGGGPSLGTTRLGRLQRRESDAAWSELGGGQADRPGVGADQPPLPQC